MKDGQSKHNRGSHSDDPNDTEPCNCQTNQNNQSELEKRLEKILPTISKLSLSDLYSIIAMQAEEKDAKDQTIAEWKEQCRRTAEGGAENIKLIAELKAEVERLQELRITRNTERMEMANKISDLTEKLRISEEAQGIMKDAPEFMRGYHKGEVFAYGVCEVEISDLKEKLKLAEDSLKNGIIESCGEYFKIKPGCQKGKIWIESTGGEGGDFDQDDLFMHIREFYEKRF